jgi:hypothetical protein
VSLDRVVPAADRDRRSPRDGRIRLMGGRGWAQRCADFFSRTTARKVAATVATVAAWAALTGLVTFGRFENETLEADRLGTASIASVLRGR